jgi:hypothetical protein
MAVPFRKFRRVGMLSEISFLTSKTVSIVLPLRPLARCLNRNSNLDRRNGL